MKTNRILAMAAAAILATTITSCNKEENNVQNTDLTVRIEGENLTCGTAALYLKGAGDLLCSKKWEGEGLLTFSGLGADSCLLYVLGNGDIEWPANASGIEGMTIETKGGTPLLNKETLWSGQAELTVSLGSPYGKATITPAWEAGWDFTVSAAYTSADPEATVPFGAWGYTVRAYPVPGQAGKDELADFNRGKDLTLTVAGDTATSIVIEGTRLCGDGIDRDEAYMIKVKGGGDRKYSVTFNGKENDSVKVVCVETDTRTAEFTYEDPDECPDVTAGDRHVNDVTVFASNGETDFTVTLSWKGVPELEGKASVRIGETGDRQGLGSDGKIEVGPTGPAESLPIYIESSYEGYEEYFQTFTCLKKTFTVKFVTIQ